MGFQSSAQLFSPQVWKQNIRLIKRVIDRYLHGWFTRVSTSLSALVHRSRSATNFSNGNFIEQITPSMSTIESVSFFSCLSVLFFFLCLCLCLCLCLWLYLWLHLCLCLLHFCRVNQSDREWTRMLPEIKKKMIESINRYKSILSGLVFKNSWSLLRLNDGKNRLLKNRKKRKNKWYIWEKNDLITSKTVSKKIDVELIELEMIQMNGHPPNSINLRHLNPRCH